MIEMLLSYSPALLAVVLGALGWLFHRQTWARDFLERLAIEARAVALEVEQTYVTSIKAASADGELTDAEKTAAFNLALGKLKSNLGAPGLRRIARVLGLEAAQVDGLLATRIEASVKTYTKESP